MFCALCRGPGLLLVWAERSISDCQAWIHIINHKSSCGSTTGEIMIFKLSCQDYPATKSAGGASSKLCHPVRAVAVQIGPALGFRSVTRTAEPSLTYPKVKQKSPPTQSTPRRLCLLTRLNVFVQTLSKPRFSRKRRGVSNSKTDVPHNAS